MKNKNQIIREAISATRSKRKSQACKTFRFKVDRSSLSATQRDVLKMFFIETKRLYNYILSQNQNGIPIPESVDYKRYNTIRRRLRLIIQCQRKCMMNEVRVNTFSKMIR